MSVIEGPGEFTQLLARSRDGDRVAHDRMITLIYADLRRLAHLHLSSNRWLRTLDTTSVIHESYLRLISPAAQHVQTRHHFMNLAARTMRQIICDYARKRMREEVHVDRDADLAEADASRLETEVMEARQLVALEEALRDLARIDERLVSVVDCRFFAGMSEQETADILETSLRTVQGSWSDARAWLADNMRESQ